jgi:hypothetical protein
MDKIIYIILLGAIIFMASCATDQGAGVMPVEQKHYQGIAYVSGGIGLDEREKLTATAKNFSLKLVFAVKSREYLSDVKVKITDSSGKKVLDAVADGPWFFADLPTGKYTVTVSLKGAEKQSAANVVKGQRQTMLSFYWN